MKNFVKTHLNSLVCAVIPLSCLAALGLYFSGALDFSVDWGAFFKFVKIQMSELALYVFYAIMIGTGALTASLMYDIKQALKTTGAIQSSERNDIFCALISGLITHTVVMYVWGLFRNDPLSGYSLIMSCFSSFALGYSSIIYYIRTQLKKDYNKNNEAKEAVILFSIFISISYAIMIMFSIIVYSESQKNLMYDKIYSGRTISIQESETRLKDLLDDNDKVRLDFIDSTNNTEINFTNRKGIEEFEYMDFNYPLKDGTSKQTLVQCARLKNGERPDINVVYFENFKSNEINKIDMLVAKFACNKFVYKGIKK